MAKLKFIKIGDTWKQYAYYNINHIISFSETYIKIIGVDNSLTPSLVMTKEIYEKLLKNVSLI